MAREALRRTATSPSPLSSPTPSAVAAFAVRKDTSSPFVPSAAFRDVASPLSASHASLSTDPVHATLSPRPMSPAAYRIDSSNTHGSGGAARLPKTPHNSGARQVSNESQSTRTRSAADPSTATTTIRTDKAGERAFYRRILFQNLAASERAPSITHDADLDHEIYLLLAYLLRETVLPWYSKLTPDREFLTQITSIISSIIHVVVERQTRDVVAATATSVLEGDLHASRSTPSAELLGIHTLLSHDIPLILRQHCSDFRQAQAKAESVWAPLGTQSSSSVAVDLFSRCDQDQQRRQQVHEQLPPLYQEAFGSSSSTKRAVSPLQLALQFQAASPHPGLDLATGSLDGKIDLAYLRIAVLNLLSSVLPADEFAPDTEKFIVRDVLVTVLRGALARSFRPWFFVQSLHKVLDAAGWATHPILLFPGSDDETDDRPEMETEQSASGTGAASAVLNLLTRLPAMLLQIWTFAALTALPFLVRAYFDLFNVQRARKKRMHPPSRPDDVAALQRSSSVKGGLSSSLSTGSLVERKMHGRYPSRKFHLSNDDIVAAQAGSSTMQANFGTTRADPLLGSHHEAQVKGQEVGQEADLTPDYVGNWLDAAEEVLSASSHAVMRMLFGLIRTILDTTGLAESVNRTLMRRINTELKDPKKLTKMVGQLRRILLPDGHLPPSVPDPDIETQEAEWIRLRTRLVAATTRSTKASQEAYLPWLLRRMLLGSADVGLRRGDATARIQDTHIQLQRLTTWLEPFCSPQAAGPNTLLATLMLERVMVVLCPDLTLS